MKNKREYIFSKLESFKKEIALIYEEKRIKYDDLLSKIFLYEKCLKENGVKRGDIVGIMLPNSPGFVYSLFAIWKIGAVAVPINILFKRKELEYVVKHSGMSVVISGEGFFSEMAGEYVMVKGERKIAFFNTKSMTNEQEMKHNHIDNVAIIIYTSGTTNNPKGVMLTFENLFSNVDSWFTAVDHKPQDVVLLTLPLFHIFGLTLTLLTTLFIGGKCVILPRFSPEKVVELINEYNVTIFPGVPTMFAYLENLQGINPLKLRSLRFCICGGAPLSPDVLVSFERRFGVPILEGYGLSEASPLVAINSYHKRKINSVGLPVSGVKVKIVDKNGFETKTNKIGEIIIQGKNVMKGYFRMPDITADTLKNEWLYTGDLGKKDNDGFIFITDRKKDLIITGGYNVYPKEVETVLLEKPEIYEAAVIGIPDRLKGEIVKAVIVFKDGMRCSAEDVITHCKARMSAYKCPKNISIVKNLPKNATGKILKNILRTQ